MSTHAIPQRLCHGVVGALDLFQTTSLRLDDDIALALGRPVVISNVGQVLQCCRGASRPAGAKPSRSRAQSDAQPT